MADRAPSGRPLTRYERNERTVFDPDAALRDLTSAYAINDREPPPYREWCEVCRLDFRTLEQVDRHACPGPPLR